MYASRTADSVNALERTLSPLAAFFAARRASITITGSGEAVGEGDGEAEGEGAGFCAGDGVARASAPTSTESGKRRLGVFMVMAKGNLKGFMGIKENSWKKG